MANNYEQILSLVNAGNQMGLSNTIKRDYGIPLDFTSVQASFDDAIIYAATSTLAYVGQTVAVGAKLYIISDTASGTYTVGEGESAVTYNNYLAEVGSKTEGDGNTIELDGQTLKLAGLTGLDNSKTYVPSLVNGKLVWAEPDTSTAEGQAQEINALKTRTESLEKTINGVEASEGVEAVKGLVNTVAENAQAIADEASARDAADKALEDKIAEALQAAKNYADENDADTIYDDTELANRVKALEDEERYDETALANRVAELENAVNGSEEVEGLEARVSAMETFWDAAEDSDGIVNKLKEIQEYIASDETGAAAMAGDIKANADAIEALNGDAEGSVNKKIADAIEPFATKETLEEVKEIAEAAQTAQEVSDAIDAKIEAENLGQYAIKTEVDEALADKVDASTYSDDKATFALKADVEEALASKIDNGSIAHSSESLAEGVTVEGTKLNIVVDAYTKEETRNYVASVIEDMTGGESAADVLLALNNHISTYEEKVGQLDAKDSAQDTAIATAQVQADKGVEEAAKANASVAALESGQVATNKEDISAVKGRLTTLETAKGDHETRLGSAEGKITSLETTTGNNSTAIGELQGDVSALEAEDARIIGLIEALDTNKANASNVYTKEEVNTKVQEALDAVDGIDLTPYAKSDDVDVTVAAINANIATKANAEDVYTKDLADELFLTADEVDSRINTLINAADPDGGKTISDIQNLVKYVDENAGEIAALITSVEANSTAISKNIDDIAAINAALAAVVQPKASTEISVAENGELGIIELSTDKLVQGKNTLVLHGGSSAVDSTDAE